MYNCTLVVRDPQGFSALQEAVEASERFVLTCHVKPDGDALGSVLGLGLALGEMGREVTFFVHGKVPGSLGFLPGSESIVGELPDPLPNHTTLVILDCNEPGRIGPEHSRLIEQARKVLVLDHHVMAGDVPIRHPRCVAYVDPGVFATGALVFRLLCRMGWPVSKAVATNLYTAILTDTGCFRHSNTTEAAFEMAKELVSRGADPYYIAQRLYQSYPQRRLELLGLVLRTLEVRCHGRVAVLQATPEMFHVTGAVEEDAEDFVGYARSIDTVELAVFIREVHADRVSVSLRSKNQVDVAELARKFGGGGHVRAAGFKLSGTASEARESLLAEIDKLFQG